MFFPHFSLAVLILLLRKRYTLSEITKTILADLDDEVQVTVYLEGDFPAGFKRLRNSTADLLRDFKTYSKC
jgi:hypothetical protein